ncbi:MAG: hypothetical protein ACIALR_15705 [Blastopirellula sp. JB062]
MRAASFASTLLFVAVWFATLSAQEPENLPISAEQQIEIDEIRAALGPEFRIASQAFGADVPAASPEQNPASAQEAFDADAAASSFFLGFTPPSFERAAMFVSLAQSDVESLTSRGKLSTKAETEQIHLLEKQCQEMADQLKRLRKLRSQKEAQLR